MRKIIVGLSVIALAVVFTGCNKIGGNNQAVTDLQNKVDDLQAQVDDLNTMIQDLQDQFDEHMEKYHKGGMGKPSTGGTGRRGTGGKVKPAKVK